MKFKLYIVAGNADIYKEEIKPYIEILNKYNFNESKNHDLDYDDKLYLRYDFKYMGTIEIENLDDMILLRKDLGINFIVEENNRIILYNDYIE